MADDVQAALDEMVPALQDLQDRQLFTADEIHQIVDRRRNSEYDLRRIQDARKADFLRYIQAEVDLEKLRQLRYKKLARQRQQEQTPDDTANAEHETKLGKSIGDSHIVNHIHRLWRRTLIKFGKSDVSLYLQYAEFCKEIHAHTALSRILAEALQLFPHEAGLWWEAASHEFFALGSMQNARVLMQRGIRAHNQQSHDLWLQLFALELHFVQRLQARKGILQGDSSKQDKNSDNKKQEGSDSAPDETEEADPFHVARVVFRNAVTAIPKDVAFRLKFWDQCRLFPDTAGFQKEIVQSIRDDLCKDNPDAWMAWALFQWENKQKTKAADKSTEDDDEGEPDNEDEDNKASTQAPSPKKRRLNDDSTKGEVSEGTSVLDVLRQATQMLPTGDMYLKAIRMITRYIASLQEEADQDEEDEEEDADISKGIDLLETLFQEAEKADFFSSDLVMEQALLLSRLERKDEAADCLKRFADARPTEDALKVWLHLAELSEEGPVKILQSALNKTEMNHPTYYELVLHLFGAKLQGKEDAGLMSLFEKITLLTPGFVPLQEMEEPIFGVRHALDACLHFLQYLNDKNDVTQARKVYKTVLIESSLGSIFSSSFDDESLIDLVEEAVKVEKSAYENDKDSGSQKHLVRLYDEAAKLFGSTEVGRTYQEKKRQEMLGVGIRRPDHCDPKFLLRFEDRKASSALLEAFEKYQIVHIKGHRLKSVGNLGWKDLVALFESLSDEDKASWCVETPGDGRKGTKDVEPNEFLNPSSSTRRRGYCSFLVQKDKKAYKHLLSRLPTEDPLPGIKWKYPSGAIWMFFGRNPTGNLNLEGRPEHTDSISFDGTWHYQLSGSKKWIIRPTRQLLDHFKNHGVREWDKESRIHLNCEEGDILCINTRLWFHRTLILPQECPSVSYARDFFCKDNPDSVQSTLPDSKKGEQMMNVDGLYATDNIEEGTIVFTENDMPDCEMHRSSTDPNCKVVELEDGSAAVVALRPIAAGEFFCVPESDSDEDDDEEEEYDDNDDDDEDG